MPATVLSRNLSRFMPLVLEEIRREESGALVLADVNLRFQPGSFNVLLGPTGSGKTSLLRIIAGLDRPTRGRVSLGGKDLAKVSVRNRNVAMVYQQFINYPNLTAFENIASPLRLQRKSTEEIGRRVIETARLLGIDKVLERLPGELSGGQQQRLALARALIKNADLVLLDEPLANLDYKLRETLREEIRDIFAGSTTIVVYATTEPREALLVGDTIAVMSEGRVEQHGAALEVYYRPRTSTVGRILSEPAMNLFPGRVDDRGRLFLPQGTEIRLRRLSKKRQPAPADVTDESAEVPVPDQVVESSDDPREGGHEPLGAVDHIPPPGNYIVGVRSHHFSIKKKKPGEESVPLKGKVELVEISGSETFIYTRLGATPVILNEPGVHEHRPGEELEYFLNPEKIYIFRETGALVSAPP